VRTGTGNLHIDRQQREALQRPARSLTGIQVPSVCARSECHGTDVVATAASSAALVDHRAVVLLVIAALEECDASCPPNVCAQLQPHQIEARAARPQFTRLSTAARCYAAPDFAARHAIDSRRPDAAQSRKYRLIRL